MSECFSLVFLIIFHIFPWKASSSDTECVCVWGFDVAFAAHRIAASAICW